MKYSGGLTKKEREDIFKLFLDKHRLKFNEIEKSIKIRSNMVSYHLERMVKDNLLEKQGDYYQLTKNSEKFIPYFEHVVGEELSPLPIILTAAIHNDEILLIKRNKRPYKDYWSLFGGKMQMGEDFEKTSLRFVKDKGRHDSTFKSINSIMHENVLFDDVIQHSFLLFFTKVETKTKEEKHSDHGELKWFKLNEIDDLKIIPSDKWFIQNKLNETLNIPTNTMEERDGVLQSFNISE